MGMNFKELSAVMVEANVGAAKASASRRAGTIFNDRLVNLVRPQLPVMIRGYAETEFGRFVIANLVAAAIVKYGSSNDKLMLLADAGISDAADKLFGSLNLEDTINGVIDGIDVTGLTSAADATRGGAGSVLRKAADVVDPTEATA